MSCLALQAMAIVKPISTSSGPLLFIFELVRDLSLKAKKGQDSFECLTSTI